MMKRNRRVGTFTTGLVLILFGGLFMLRMIFPAIDYTLIFSLWPLILILLGLETLISYFVSPEEKMKFDAGSVVIILLMAGFSMVMAAADFIIREVPYIQHYLY